MELSALDKYYLDVAKVASMKSTCIRRRYGAVVVSDRVVISVGHNSSTEGDINCKEESRCPRIERNIPHGTMYETCVAIHAEQRAIIRANKQDLEDATIYIYGWDVVENKEIPGIPCVMCERFIKASGISKVVYNTDLE